MSDNVLFYVQHLLGIGHVVRSARIARALQRAKFKVTIAYGGEPVKGLQGVQHSDHDERADPTSAF